MFNGLAITDHDNSARWWGFQCCVTPCFYVFVLGTSHYIAEKENPCEEKRMRWRLPIVSTGFLHLAYTFRNRTGVRHEDARRCARCWWAFPKIYPHRILFCIQCLTINLDKNLVLWRTSIDGDSWVCKQRYLWEEFPHAHTARPTYVRDVQGRWSISFHTLKIRRVRKLPHRYNIVKIYNSTQNIDEHAKSAVDVRVPLALVGFREFPVPADKYRHYKTPCENTTLHDTATLATGWDTEAL